jgi:hypothetical protein
MIRNIPAQEKRPTRKNLEANTARDNGHLKYVACLRSEEMYSARHVIINGNISWYTNIQICYSVTKNNSLSDRVCTLLLDLMHARKTYIYGFSNNLCMTDHFHCKLSVISICKTLRESFRHNLCHY